MNCCCENCGWSEIVCCEAWKPKEKETNMVEVVLCKDCKHQNWVNAETGCIVCKFGRGTNAPDWYCADGEKAVK